MTVPSLSDTSYSNLRRDEPLQDVGAPAGISISTALNKLPSIGSKFIDGCIDMLI